MLYYELLKPTKGRWTNFVFQPGIYASDEPLAKGDMPPGIISYNANRIWHEKDGVVDFVKHKGGCDGREVDMKEFTWIKLTAKEIF